MSNPRTVAMEVNDDAACLDVCLVWTFSRAGSLPQLDRAQICNQVGFKVASMLLLLLLLFWLLIFLPPREAEWRFCAVGKPAWMPV
jgi:hypothetical protein